MCFEINYERGDAEHGLISDVHWCATLLFGNNNYSYFVAYAKSFPY